MGRHDGLHAVACREARTTGGIACGESRVGESCGVGQLPRPLYKPVAFRQDETGVAGADRGDKAGRGAHKLLLDARMCVCPEMGTADGCEGSAKSSRYAGAVDNGAPLLDAQIAGSAALSEACGG